MEVDEMLRRDRGLAGACEALYETYGRTRSTTGTWGKAKQIDPYEGLSMVKIPGESMNMQQKKRSVRGCEGRWGKKE